jgi:hypothetical protein
LIFGIPVAGVLVTEVRRHTISNQPLPSSSSRSEIIRSLSFLISWVETAGLSSSVTGSTCLELTKLIGRLLDEALDYQAPPLLTSPSLAATTSLQGVDNMGVVTPAQTTVSVQLSTEETMNRPEPQNQLQGLIEGEGPIESLWFGMGMGMDFGIADDAFLGLECDFASDGMNLLDEPALDINMDTRRV